MKLLWIAAFGAAGTLARYGLSSWVNRLAGGSFPWGTWVVNLLGCFLFGLIVELCEGRGLIPAAMRPWLLTGFLGAFTTFSTFSFESAGLLEQGAWGALAANMLGQVALGVAAVAAGLALGRAA